MEVIAHPALYQRLLPRTLRWLRQFGVAERHREDVAQVAWIRVLRSLENSRSDRPFEPWLMTLTFRAACAHLEQADVHREPLSEAGEVEPGATPATEALVIDAANTLETLLQRLKPDQRTVLMMVDGEELDPAAVAEFLGVSLNTVYSRLSRARVQFQHGLERLRTAEQHRLGAAAVLPAFLFTGRALFEAGREVPPVSVETEARIWEGIQRGLDALDVEEGEDDEARSNAPRPSSLPPAPSVSLPWLGKLARWPLSSPVGMAATIALSGIGGGGVAAWWMHRGAPAPAAIVQEEARSAAPSSAAAAPSVTEEAREELSTLEATYTLYVQGKCEAARAKLGNRTGRVHANDYAVLRGKIDACLARDGGAP